jgi:sigma-B regulation protein RsbU (phosphoserine phosphatase)
MRRARILVVDDEPGMLRAVARILGGKHEVTALRSGREALAAAAPARYDLAILDVRMPDLNGFELTAALKARDPELDVILMTGSSGDPDRKLIRAIRENAFYFIHKPFDREVLETLVDRCLDLRRLAEENRGHVRRLESELGAARAFQQSLLPPPAARFGTLAIDARYRPCAELGGDFYDYAVTAGGGLAAIVADVSGHGVAAAMLTGIVKSAFRAAHGGGPRAVIERISASIRSFGRERFVTAFAVEAEAAGDSLRYASAGHPAALLVSAAGEARELGSTGLLLSPALPAASWREVPARFGPGDALLIYTDGVTEAAAGEEQFGVDRLRAAAASEGADPGGAALDAILEASLAFTGGRPPADDQTLAVVRRVARD